jgi:murein DD-endopeptidase MepM/ murein hydrolase activator NlpD
MAGPIRDATDAYQQMEAMMLRQMLQSSGAFKAKDMAGGQIRADMFIETLADAVAKAGGIGVARMLEDSLSNSDAGEPSVAKTPAQPTMLAAPTPGSAAALPAVLHLGRPEEVTSPFGRRTDPVDGGTKYHTGVDLRAPEGSPILAATGGVVKSAGQRGGYGNAVEIDHGNGLSTLYAHASELLVTAGEKVNPGQAIGRAGMTGHATGPHLHFEVRLNDRPVDPTRALNRYRDRVDDQIAVKPHGRGAP